MALIYYLPGQLLNTRRARHARHLKAANGQVLAFPQTKYPRVRKLILQTAREIIGPAAAAILIERLSREIKTWPAKQRL